MTARRRNWLLIFVVLVFIVVLRVVSGPSRPETGYFDTRQPQVIAFRGGEGLRPGNTMIAFSHALSLGVDALHMDVRMTADKALVLFSGEMAQSTTDGEGMISNMDLVTIQALDAAYRWKDAEQAVPYQGRGVRVPKLTDVLKRFPAVRLNIQIHQDDPELLDALCERLLQYDAQLRTLVFSDDRSSILAFREVCPSVATGTSHLEAALFALHAKVGLISLFKPSAHAVQVPETVWGFDMHTQALAEAADNRGMRIHAGVVDDAEQLRMLMMRKIGGVLTRRPDIALAVREEVTP